MEKCPASSEDFLKCGKTGHFARVCRSNADPKKSPGGKKSVSELEGEAAEGSSISAAHFCEVKVRGGRGSTPLSHMDYNQIKEAWVRAKPKRQPTLKVDVTVCLEKSFWKTCTYISLCTKNGITFNPKKFQFAQDKVKFAGFKITKLNVRPQREYLQAILDFPKPTDITWVRSWFGLVNQVAYSFCMKKANGAIQSTPQTSTNLPVERAPGGGLCEV